MVPGDLRSELRRFMRDPLWNSLHVRLLRDRKGPAESRTRFPIAKREQMLDKHPEFFSSMDWMNLLSDPATCLWIHRNYWKRVASRRGSGWGSVEDS